MISTRDFLLRILPWPPDDEPGYINVHAQCHMPDGKTPWTGLPTRDIDQFFQVVQKYLGWQSKPDLYYCMSRQGKTATSTKGETRAAKSQQEALALKSLYIDLDVKEGGYGNQKEALADLSDFCTQAKIPFPTACVSSGWGIHIYWCSSRALSPGEWRPYAEGLKALALAYGLKCDAGVTGDSARVLRIPGTFNLKRPVVKPVTILSLREKDYDFETDLSALLSVPVSSMGIRSTAGLIIADKPDAAFASLPMDSLAEGLEYDPLPPLDWVPLEKECGWFAEALKTGGKDFSQGLWNLTTLAATFLENGHELAHKMAKGHPGYSSGETEVLWERKLAERESRGLGWPSCKAIQAEGCKSCALCPHLAAGKSPLNLARVPNRGISSPGITMAPAVEGGTTGTAPVTETQDDKLVPLTVADLPPDYEIKDNIVYKLVQDKAKGGIPVITSTKLFHNKFFGPVWAQTGPPAINFHTSTSLGLFKSVCIPKTKMTSYELEKTLFAEDVSPITENFSHAKGFIVSWLAKLNEAAKALSSMPFGWHMEGDKCLGFSYGSVLYKSDGTRGPIGQIDRELQRIYTPDGEEEPWHDAFRLITDQKRPGLEVIVASSFAAPLMFAAGHYSVVLAVYGDSGASKSSAARVAAAVWGKPVLSKEVETATAKSVLDRLGQIRNLPYYWDEIKNEHAQKKAYDMLYVGSAGSDGGRLTADIQHREKKTWSTICGIFSNPPFSSFVIKENPNTDAGLARLFEWKEEKPKAKRAPGMISISDADRIFFRLDSNYGQIGKRWASFLGANRQKVYDRVVKEGHWFEQEVNDPNRNSFEERYWVALCSAIQAGAELANENLGLRFDTEAIRSFLVTTFKAQRHRKAEENIVSGSFDHTEQYLTGFLKAYRKSTLRTSQTEKGPIDIVSSPQDGHPTNIHWNLGTSELMFSQAALYTWLRQDTVRGDPRTVKEGLKHHFEARFNKGTLGKGTTLRENPEQIGIIPVKTGTPLWELMQQKDNDHE